MTGRELPTGTVTFVFTDIEGSTKLTQDLGEEAWTDLLEAHGRILRSVTAAHGGVEVNTEGDAFFLAFDRPTDAVQAAAEVQLRLTDELPIIRVRIGIHTGEARVGADDYVGIAVVKAARVSAAAHGGQTILTEATLLALADLPPGITLQSLGSHRLKDLGDPIGLHQLRHPKLDSDFPPLRTLDRVEHNIPVQLSSFIGRDEDLAAASELLGGHRLLTLTGPGGTGKTRFAYQLAGEHIESFPDGVWVLELAAVSDAEGIAKVAISALGLQEQADRPPLETFVDWVSKRTALFVFDNCEHVVDAAALTIAELLRKAPAATVVATSREALRVAGERVFVLAPLSTPDTDDGAFDAESVRLFVERATDADSSFELNLNTSFAVADICRRLEGMPLAIELAAAWVRSLTPAQIAQRLGDRFQLLDKGVRGSEARQASLRGAIAWSYELLSPAEQVLLRRLSVFEGGWTLDTAEAVCGGSPIDPDGVLPLLDGLVDKSLAARTTVGGQPRFQMLETIRAFAAGERAAGGDDDLGVRHSDFFAELAAMAASQPEGSADQARFFELLDADSANLEAALTRLATDGAPETAARLAIDLTNWWLVRGHLRAGHESLGPLLAELDLEPLTAARLHLSAGTLASELDLPETNELLESAARRAGDLGDDRLRAEAMDRLGRVAFNALDFSLAEERYAEALILSRRLGDPRSAARTLVFMGDLYGMTDRYDEALGCLRGALKVFEEIGDRTGEIQTVIALSTLLNDVFGDLTGSRDLALRGLRLAREIGFPIAESCALTRLAIVEYNRQNLQLASDMAVAAGRISSRAGHLQSEMQAWWVRIEILEGEGRLVEARRLAEDGLIAAGRPGLASERQAFTNLLAGLDLTEGRYADALFRAEGALGMGSRLVAGLAALGLGRLNRARPHLEKLLEDLEKHATLSAGGVSGHELAAVRRLMQIGRFLAASDREGGAAELIAAGWALHSPLGRVAPFELKKVEEASARCRSVLGDDEFERACTEGAAMDWKTASARAADLLSSLAYPDEEGGDVAVSRQ